LQTAARWRWQLGDETRAFERIRDHFARRRAQGSVGLDRYDIQFCDDCSGRPTRATSPSARTSICARAEHLRQGLRSQGASNRSDLDLHNATLVLCVRFTDMHPEDHVSIEVARRKPVVPARQPHENFGDLDLDYDWCGTKRDGRRRRAAAARGAGDRREPCAWDRFDRNTRTRPSRASPGL
jgi:hypothetical protein